MNKSIKLQVEKIANGFLFTTIKDNVASKKQYQESKTDFFKILKNDEAIGALIEDNDDMMMLEITRHDIITGITEETIPEILNKVVERAVYNPFPTKKEEDTLRLSVTTENCYSAEKLREIDFLECSKLVPLSDKRKADIMGLKHATFVSAWSKIRNNTATYQHATTRMHFTILAKYYEAITGVTTSKKDELEKLTEGIKKAIFGLDNIFKKNTHIHSNSVAAILSDLKYLIGDKTNN